MPHYVSTQRNSSLETNPTVVKGKKCIILRFMLLLLIIKTYNSQRIKKKHVSKMIMWIFICFVPVKFHAQEQIFGHPWGIPSWCITHFGTHWNTQVILQTSPAGATVYCTLVLWFLNSEHFFHAQIWISKTQLFLFLWHMFEEKCSQSDWT